MDDGYETGGTPPPGESAIAASARQVAVRTLTFLGYSNPHEDTESLTDDGLATFTANRVHARLAAVQRPVRASMVHLLVGDGGSVENLIFFTAGDYTPAAVAYANKMKVALFTIAADGRLAHANRAGLDALLNAAGTGTSDTPPLSPSRSDTLNRERGVAAAARSADAAVLDAWALRRYAKERTEPTRRGTYLPLVGGGLLAVATAAMASTLVMNAGSTGVGAAVEVIAAPAAASVVALIWGLVRVREHRRVERVRRRDLAAVVAPPTPGRALVVRAMSATALRYPRDREDFILLRNAMAVNGRLAPFTASVLLWTLTVQGRLPGTLEQWVRETSVPGSRVD